MRDLKKLIRTIPHYPKEGIMFRDITTLLKDARGFKKSIDALKKRYKDKNIDYVCGVEARGFIVGAALAYSLKKGFVPIRKKGKLPGKSISQSYSLEYGTDQIEIHEDAIERGSRVLLVDDLLATGGTVQGAIQLIEKLGGKIVEVCFLIDLPELGGSKFLKKEKYKSFSLFKFQGH